MMVRVQRTYVLVFGIARSFSTIFMSAFVEKLANNAATWLESARIESYGADQVLILNGNYFLFLLLAKGLQQNSYCQRKSADEFNTEDSLCKPNGGRRAFIQVWQLVGYILQSQGNSLPTYGQSKFQYPMVYKCPRIVAVKTDPGISVLISNKNKQ